MYWFEKTMTDPTVIAIFALGLIAVFLMLRATGAKRKLKPPPKSKPKHRPKTKPKPERQEQLDPTSFIVVDGSNIMHWDGEPSERVVNRVLVALQKKGFVPLVYFDANVGYKLWDRYANADYVAPRIGVKPDQVLIVPKGVTADERLLEYATATGLRVLTNDRFLEWRTRFPKAGDKGFLVKGTIRDGTVMFRGI